MVPRDASVLDFVFSDAPGGEGSTYDNRGGLVSVALQVATVLLLWQLQCSAAAGAAQIASLACAGWHEGL